MTDGNAPDLRTALGIVDGQLAEPQTGNQHQLAIRSKLQAVGAKHFGIKRGNDRLAGDIYDGNGSILGTRAITWSETGSTMAKVWSRFESASSERCGVDCAHARVAQTKTAD